MYNILILSNPNDIYAKEDEMLLKSFKKDGNNVLIQWIDYDEKLDDEFDVILRRNTWVQEKEKTLLFDKYNEILKERLKNKPVLKVNFYQVDSNGKNYLIDYYKKGLHVIPSADNLDDASSFEDYNEFVLKPLNSFGSGIDQKIVKKEELEKEFKKGLLIQPKLNFKSEIQCYFVADELMYSFEFIPSKYPNYPTPKVIELTQDEKKCVDKFVKEVKIDAGFLRLDFLRLEKDELVLLEVEATSPFMALSMLEEKLRNRVIEKYKQNIYDYISLKKI
ncbi:MAG: hypothetical protein IKM97_05885 [Clostridia bacterium]|nr:hypothetical protein [Clostridia bacterium]